MKWHNNSNEVAAENMIKTNPNSGKDKAAATTSSMDAAAVTAIIMSVVILLVIVAIFVYIRKYKRDFLNNQVIVRFRRPNAHHFSNEDSITVNDFYHNVDATNTTVVNDTVFEDNNNNNNKTYSTHHFGDKELMSKDAYGREEAQPEEEEAIPEAKDGDNRFKNFVGGCKQKLKLNFKKDDSMTTPLDMTVPYDDTILEDQTWHTSIRDVPIRQASHSPAVLAISSREFDTPTIQPANPPRTILKIFGESADVENDAMLPDSRPQRRRKSPLTENVLSPYLTPTCSECEELGEDHGDHEDADETVEADICDDFDDFYDEGHLLV